MWEFIFVLFATGLFGIPGLIISLLIVFLMAGNPNSNRPD